MIAICRDIEPVDLPRSMVVATPDEPVDHVYFPNSGILSVIAISPQGNRAEAGLFGRDGFSPTCAALGIDRSALEVFVQVPGEGLRLPYPSFLAALERSSEFRSLLLKFVHCLAIQTAFTSLSNAVHQIDKRLARWLLMCHDRTESDEIALTHEFISLMLAVRRPSVTTALHELEGSGFIRAERGYLTMRNRIGLEAFAADAYGQPEREYQRLIGPIL